MTDPTETLSEAIRTFVMRLRKASERLRTEGGASYVRTKWLFHLATSGPVRATDLAKATGLAPRTVTEAIDALERDGLIRRQVDPADRRVKMIAITREGETMLRHAKPAIGAFNKDVFGILTDQEQALMTSMLNRLTLNIDTLDLSQLDTALAPLADPSED